MGPNRQLLSKLHADTKPRVLLVDDHALMLESVSSLLADHFEVAGMATSGEEALAKASEVDPDLIVLDVTMPGLDGFQTMRALQADGSRAPVVFLSLHDSHDYVDEAFGAGGRGYVLKMRARSDLAAAIDQVLSGRLFAPSVPGLLRLFNGTPGHAMLVRGDGDAWLNSLAAFFDLALQQGDATCIVGTEAVREALAERLRVSGWDVGDAVGNERYLAIDADAALDRFMRDGMPDADRLAEVAAELDQYRIQVAKSPTRRLTIFGTMSSMLTLRGNTRAAIALEQQWTSVTRHLPIFTVCGFPTSCFGETSPSDFFAAACAEHGAVCHAPGV